MGEPYGAFTSRVVPLPAENVDTDQIVPARYLKVTDKAGVTCESDLQGGGSCGPAQPN